MGSPSRPTVETRPSSVFRPSREPLPPQGAQAQTRQKVLLSGKTRTRGWMEIPGDRRGSGSQEEGQGRGLPQGTEGGQEGQGRSPRRSQDCQEDRAHAEGRRVLWTLKQLYVLMYRLVHELSSHCVRLDQLQLLK